MGKLSGITTVGRPQLMDAMTPILALLVAAGIRVTVDSKRLNPPGCLLHPPELTWRFRAGDFTAAHRLLVVASSKDRLQSLDDMGALLDQVAVALADRQVTARPAQVETSDQSTYLTAYELTWTERVRQDEGTAP